MDSKDDDRPAWETSVTPADWVCIRCGANRSHCDLCFDLPARLVRLDDGGRKVETLSDEQG